MSIELMLLMLTYGERVETSNSDEDLAAFDEGRWRWRIVRPFWEQMRAIR